MYLLCDVAYMLNVILAHRVAVSQLSDVWVVIRIPLFWMFHCPLWPNFRTSTTERISDSETPLASLCSPLNTYKHTHTNAFPWQLSRATLLIFSGCCVCTHRNHVITACQGFLCWETFAYSNVSRNEALRCWFSNMHIHIVSLRAFSEQLMKSGSLFLASFFPILTIKSNWASSPVLVLLTCIFMSLFVHVWIPSYPCTNTSLIHSPFISCQETLSGYK